MSGPEPQIRANILLCDAAQVVADKLYVLGGGWSYMWKAVPEAQLSFFVAIDLALPWDFANRHIKVVVRLMTEDHDLVEPRNLDAPALIEGEVVAGRAPMMRAGSDLHVPLALPFPPMILEPGGYVVEVLADGDPITRAPFQVVLLPGGPQ